MLVYSFSDPKAPFSYLTRGSLAKSNAGPGYHTPARPEPEGRAKKQHLGPKSRDLIL